MSPLLPRVLPSPEGKPLPPKDTADAFRAFPPPRPCCRPPQGAAATLFADLSKEKAAATDVDAVIVLGYNDSDPAAFTGKLFQGSNCST